MTGSTKPKRINVKAAAQNFYRKNMSFKESLIDAGASPTQASKGKALLLERKALCKAFQKEHERQFRKLELLGGKFSPEERAAFVRGGLMSEAITGKGAPKVRSLELLGRDKEINMFTPDTAIGIFQMQIPSDWESRYLTTEPSAATEPKVLPAKFVHAALESGKVEIPDKLHIENESVPVTIPSPTTSNFSEDDFETL